MFISTDKFIQEVYYSAIINWRCDYCIYADMKWFDVTIYLLSSAKDRYREPQIVVDV